MLTRIALKNFKLHSETAIEARPLTVLIGPNNSGKTSVFQSLLLWRQAAQRSESRLCLGISRYGPDSDQPYLLQEDQLLDIGDFDQVVRRGEREISISIAGEAQWPKTIEYGPGPTDSKFEVRIRENRLVYQKGELSYEISTLGTRGEVRWDWVWGQTATRRVSPAILVKDINANLELQASDNLGLLEAAGFTSSSALSPEKNIAAQELARRFGEAPRKLLGSIHPVFPLRGFEEVGYPLAEASAETLDRLALSDRTIALLSVLAYNRQIEQRLSGWLEELLGIRIETKLLPGKRVTIHSSPSGSTVDGSLFSNEGTGANQLPFILVPIGLTPAGETILLSEPEVHLHPRAQVHLTRLLVTLAKKENRQFFIETHSEHVLHGLLNAVATGALKQSDIAIYYFENKAGKAVCTHLRINETGAVEGGLPGFFDQSLGELAEYLEALKSK